MILRREHRLALAIGSGILLAWFAGMAIALRALTPPDTASGRLLVIFPPAVTELQAMQAIGGAGGRTFGQAWFRLGWDVLGEEPGLAARLRAHGAYVLTDFPWVPVLAGCSGSAGTRNARQRRNTN